MENNTSFIRPEDLWREIGIQAGQTIVHLGCGAGFYLIPAAKLVGRMGKVIGIDLMPHLLEEAESRARRENISDIVHTIRANLEEDSGSTLADNIADWVLVANILHQSDPVAILTEAKRLSKDSGRIIVIEWDIVATPLGPPPDQRIAKNRVREHASSIGLNVEKEFSPSPYHYGIIFTA
jgi:ubiquinone/menaquinone biosynthesis C-methylase UbiE